MKFLRGINEVIFPTRCISCSTLGSSLCINCRLIWSHKPYFQNISHYSGEKLLVSSAVIYTPTASHILLSAKESNIDASNKLIALALEFATENLLLKESSFHLTALVPIPSRPQAIRSRGRDFLRVTTKILSEKFNLPILPILGYSREVKDQSRLNSEQRWNNLNGSLVVKVSDISKYSLTGVLLVDDLVTTGATLLAAEKALNQAGIRSIGAVTACVAQPLRYGGGRAPF